MFPLAFLLMCNHGNTVVCNGLGKKTFLVHEDYSIIAKLSSEFRDSRAALPPCKPFFGPGSWTGAA